MPPASELHKFFSQPQLLRQALRHRSCAGQSNERLEYLGDAVLGLLVAQELYRRYPALEEGALSQLRSTLVCGETLTQVAREQAVDKSLRLGAGLAPSDAMLACALEAIFGALYLDRGMAGCTELLHDFFGTRLSNLQPGDGRHPKTMLKEYLEGRQLEAPVYTLQHSPPGGSGIFVVECKVAPLAKHTLGEGSSRRMAERAAAQEMLEQLHRGEADAS